MSTVLTPADSAPNLATVMRRFRALALALVVAVAGCASSSSPPPSRPTGALLHEVHQVVVVASGDSRFSFARESSKDPERVLDEVLKWLPYKEVLVPLAQAVYAGLSWLLQADRASSVSPSGVTPGTVVAEAFARTLIDAGPFKSIVTTDREPVGEARRADAIVRLTVPSWGVVAVRDGTPPLVAAFADVRVQVVMPQTGVVAWEHDEDVTQPERLPAEALTRDRALAREQLVGVLERAGQRLANELLYARGGAR